MHRKRKPSAPPAQPERTLQSEPELHPAIKPYLKQENPIMEVEEEQKDSTPLIANRPNKSDHDKEEEIPPEVDQEAPLIQQDEQQLINALV